MSHSAHHRGPGTDIVALRAAAERAGTALACLFSTSDEFEAAVVRVRREQGLIARSKGAASAARRGIGRTDGAGVRAVVSQLGV
jgi:hypothetical protein